MRTGLSIYSLWNALRKGEMTVEEAFAFMQALGCESTEIANFVVPLHTPDHQYIPEMAIKLREYSDKYEVPIGAYSCGSDIGRAEGPILEGMKRYVFSEIDLAHLLGAPLIRIDLVRVMVGKDDTGIEAYDRIFERCVNVAREMADYAAQYGIMLTMENHGTLMNGADRLGKLIRAVNHPNYGVTLDIGNTVCVDENPLDLAKELIPYAKEIHVKDFYIRDDPYVIGAKYKEGYQATNDPGILGNGSWMPTKHGRFLRGAIVGHGDLPMKEMISLINQSSFDGDVLIEFEGMEDPKLASEISLKNLRQMLEMTK